MEVATREQRIQSATQLADQFRIHAAAARLRGDAATVARCMRQHRAALINRDLLLKHFREFDQMQANCRIGGDK